MGRRVLPQSWRPTHRLPPPSGDRSTGEILPWTDPACDDELPAIGENHSAKKTTKYNQSLELQFKYSLGHCYILHWISQMQFLSNPAWLLSTGEAVQLCCGVKSGLPHPQPHGSRTLDWEATLSVWSSLLFWKLFDIFLWCWVANSPECLISWSAMIYQTTRWEWPARWQSEGGLWISGDFTKYGQPVPRPDPTWGVGIAHFQLWGWRYPSCA